MSIPVLMYHAVSTPEVVSGYFKPEDLEYKINARQLVDQLTWLHNEGYETIGLEDLTQTPLPRKAVMLTFDDGHISHVKVVLPHLQRYGMKAVFFVTSGWIGKPFYLDVAGLKALSDAGMDIGAHGYSHLLLGFAPESQQSQELALSKSTLEDHLGREVSAMAWPGGSFSQRSRVLAQDAGFRQLFTSRPGHFQLTTSMDDIPRMSVMADTSAMQFRKLVKGGSYLYYRRFRAKATGSLRQFFGLERYHKLRSKWFSFIHSAKRKR